MSKIETPVLGDSNLLEVLTRRADRRDFLKYTGAGVATLVVVGCDEETQTIVEVTPPDTIIEEVPPPPESVTIDLSNDTGVLNFAYALEQLEAAFYIQVARGFYSGATTEEQRVLIDLRDHEVAHREFFRTALAGNAIIDLTVDFSAIDFGSRDSVLVTARTFEDLGVRAYNGAGPFLQSADFLVLAGKIVSVEARHASAIRDLIAPKSGEQGEGGSSFAPFAFDEGLDPQSVLDAAQPFIANEITLTGV
ncbi:MAG: ferritin-like domain-containing protein [Longimicrobiaceae bacterium]